MRRPEILAVTMLYALVAYWRAEFLKAAMVCVFTGTFNGSTIPGCVSAAVFMALGGGIVLSWLSKRGRRQSDGMWKFIGTFAAIALLVPVLAPFDPDAQGDLRTTRFAPPFSVMGVSRDNSVSRNESVLGHAESFALSGESNLSGPAIGESRLALLGTDALGRDIFSRLLYGFRISLAIGLAGGLLTALVGSCAGIAAGIGGRMTDTLLMRATDLFLALPALIVAITVVAFWGSSPLLLVAVLTGLGWMNTARIVRNETRVLRNREFVLAARLFGRGHIRIAIDHLIPNLAPVIAVSAMLQFANILTAEAALGFLGLGVQPPTPTLGNMLGEGLPYIGSCWWNCLFPGVALSGMIIAIHLAAERHASRPEIAR